MVNSELRMVNVALVRYKSNHYLVLAAVGSDVRFTLVNIFPSKEPS